MTDIEPALRAAIEREIAKLPPSSSVIPPATARAVRRRRIARAAGGAAIVLSLGLAAFAVPSALVGDGRRSTPAAHPPAKADDAGVARRLEPVTPRFELASGTASGTRWSLIAFEARLARGPSTGRAVFCSSLGIGADPRGALCELRFGDQLGRRTHLHPIADWRRDATAVYGFVSHAVAEVRVRVEGEPATIAPVRRAPPELTSVKGFFVAFVPPAADVDLSGLDASGSVLDTVTLEALPRLTIAKTGSGSGTVVGRETCPSCPRPPETVVDCGSDCWAEFEEGGGSVTLEAEPDPGSTFAGWSGACGGTRPECVLEADADLEVAARFESAD